MLYPHNFKVGDAALWYDEPVTIRKIVQRPAGADDCEIELADGSRTWELATQLDEVGNENQI